MKWKKESHWKFIFLMSSKTFQAIWLKYKKKVQNLMLHESKKHYVVNLIIRTKFNGDLRGQIDHGLSKNRVHVHFRYKIYIFGQWVKRFRIENGVEWSRWPKLWIDARELLLEIKPRHPPILNVNNLKFQRIWRKDKRRRKQRKTGEGSKDRRTQVKYINSWTRITSKGFILGK